MSSKVKKMFSKLKMSKELVVILVILSLIGFIFISSINGSLTLPFQEKQDAVNYQSDPTTVGLPGSSNGFNYSDFTPPSNLNPPADSADNFGDLIGDGPDFDAEPDEDIDDDFPRDGGPITGPGDPGDPGDPPDDNDNGDRPFDFDNQGNNGITDDNSTTRSPFDLPERQNKAENLWNLTSIELFPNTQFSFTLDLSIPQFNSPQVSNIAFFILLLGLLYFPNMVIQRLLSEIYKSNEDQDGEKNSIFYQPEESEIQKRRELQRLKRLQNFSDYLLEIISNIKSDLKQGTSPSNIITNAYLEVDAAFAKFINLKRNKSLTPLEHAGSDFESDDINNASLKEIVNLFYLTRYGNKPLGVEKVHDLIELLENLIPKEKFEDSNSGWSLFR